MRAGLVMVAVLSLGGPTLAQQDTSTATPPKKGDRVVVKGCLSGPVLEASEIAAVDASETFPLNVTFRLTGEKKLVKTMRSDQDGKVVEVTGILKSDLPRDDALPGKRVGKTRIIIGVGSPQTMQQHAAQALPVVEVKSYEAHGASCGG